MLSQLMLHMHLMIVEHFNLTDDKLFIVNMNFISLKTFQIYSVATY